jgi:hypothetical protein
MSITQPLPTNLDLSRLATVLAEWQTRWTEHWHVSQDALLPPTPFAQIIQQQHHKNYDLWHEEDKARSPDAGDRTLAGVKRRIDKLNQDRNDLMERLDEAILTMLVQRSVSAPDSAPWNTETPGAVVDRLSILSLKIFHMREQEGRKDATEEHREKCQAKRRILEQQRQDLVTSLQALLDDLFAGRKQMKIYRQFKMYNDPALNPEIYKAAKR